jgi:hypothetical protein
MSYILVNIGDKAQTFHISNWEWWALRIILKADGDWAPAGATGHWQIETLTQADAPLGTEAERLDSYEGCRLQRIGAEDVAAMLRAARACLSRCSSDPEGTLGVLQTLQGGKNPTDTSPDPIAAAQLTLGTLLKSFIAFAEKGPFFID